MAKQQHRTPKVKVGTAKKSIATIVLRWFSENGQPAPGWIRIMIRSLDPTRHSSLRNVKTQLEQFSVDAGRSPGWVFCAHTEDYLAHFPADWFSSNRMSRARDPAPVQPKPSPVPPDDGLGRH
jgi:hypothetical protein